MFIYSPNDPSIHLNHFYYILFTFDTRATAIYTPTPIPKGGKNDDFSPFSKLKGSALAHLGTTVSRELYFNPSRHNKQVWFENYGAIGT